MIKTQECVRKKRILFNEWHIRDPNFQLNFNVHFDTLADSREEFFFLNRSGAGEIRLLDGYGQLTDVFHLKIRWYQLHICLVHVS